MTNTNESVMDGDIVWGGTGQTARDILADNGSDAPTREDMIGGIVDLLGKLRKEIDDNMERLATLRGAAEQAPEAEASADSTSADAADQDAADAVATSSASEELTLEDACIIGGGALAVGGLTYMAYRALFR